MLIPGPLALTRSWVSAMYLVREAPGLLDFSSIPAILSMYSGLDPQISFFLNPPYIIFNIYEFPWDVDGILAWGGERLAFWMSGKTRRRCNGGTLSAMRL